MYILLIQDTMHFIRTGTHEQLCAIAVAEYTDKVSHVFPLDTKRYYARFSLDELKLLYKNTTGEEHHGHFYPDILNKVFTVSQECPRETRSQAVLDALAAKACPEEAPGARAQFAGPKGTARFADKGLKDLKPKAPRDPGTAYPRPAAGTATGRVWELGDLLATSLSPSDGAFRKALIAKAVAEGINPGTAATQAGKWLASKLLEMGGAKD